jgi:hypothetical protein
VHSCAAFKMSSTNSKDCTPYGSLETEAACKSLAAIANQGYAGSAPYAFYPIGCFRHTISGKFYWNTGPSGSVNSFAQALCAGTPPSRTAAACTVRLSSEMRGKCMPHPEVLLRKEEGGSDDEKTATAGPATAPPTFSSNGTAAP